MGSMQTGACNSDKAIPGNEASPFGCLSNGEKFPVMLSRRLLDNRI